MTAGNPARRWAGPWRLVAVIENGWSFDHPYREVSGERRWFREIHVYTGRRRHTEPVWGPVVVGR